MREYPKSAEPWRKTVDADGVALAAIQGLNQKLEEAVKAKDAEIEVLKEKILRLETLFNKIAEHRELSGPVSN